MGHRSSVTRNVLDRGTGPHDLKWINGKPNLRDWVPSATDPNAGTGHYGTCCVEM